MSKFVIRPGVDIPAMLKAKGYSTYKIARATKANGEIPLFGSAAMTKFRRGGLPSWGELAKLVSLLHVSPVDLIAYQTDKGTVYDLTGQRIPTAPAPNPDSVIIGYNSGYDGLPESFWTGEHEDGTDEY